MGFWEKILLSLGLLEEEKPGEEGSGREQRFPSYSRKVVSLHSSGNVKVRIQKPKDFSAVESIASCLKNRQPVLVNLAEIDRETAKRVVDFLSGAAFALSGSSLKLSSEIFIFAPSNIDLSGDFKDDLSDRNLSFINELKKES